MVADEVSQVVAQGGGQGADQDDPRQVQLALGVSEKAGEEQNGLTRHRNAGIFQKQGHAHRPIAVVIEKIAEEFEQVVRHSVAFPEIVWTLNIVNMWGRFPGQPDRFPLSY